MTNMNNKPCWSIVYSVYINKFVYSVSFSDVFFFFFIIVAKTAVSG